MVLHRLTDSGRPDLTEHYRIAEPTYVSNILRLLAYIKRERYME